MKRRLIPLIHIILLTGLAFAGVKVFYWFLEQRYAFVHALAKSMQQPIVTINPPPEQPQLLPAKNPDNQNEPSANDRENQAIQEKLHDMQKLEQIVIYLRLKGTVIRDQAHTQAVIEDTRLKMDRICRIGDKIQEATIKSILWDRVVLTLNGYEVVLAMESAQGGTSIAGMADSKKSAGPGFPVAANGQQIILNPATIDKVLNNINQSQNQIALQPHLENGKPAGVKLSGPQVSAVMGETGIKNGDIIKSVNGQEIKSMNDVLRVYESLKAAGAKYAAVQILRDGRLITIYYSVP